MDPDCGARPRDHRPSKRQGEGRRTFHLKNVYFLDEDIILAFEGSVKADDKGRFERHEDVLLVKNMSLLLVLDNTLFLDAFECVRSVFNAFNLKTKIKIKFINPQLTLTSLTIPNPPAPIGLSISMSAKVQVFKASCTFLVGSSLASATTFSAPLASPSLPTRLVNAFRSLSGNTKCSLS